MKVVGDLPAADLWPSAAAGYAAARQFMTSPAAAAHGDFAIRPVAVAGLFALQLETPRDVKPRRILGYLSAAA